MRGIRTINIGHEITRDTIHYISPLPYKDWGNGLKIHLVPGNRPWNSTNGSITQRVASTSSRLLRMSSAINGRIGRWELEIAIIVCWGIRSIIGLPIVIIIRSWLTRLKGIYFSIAAPDRYESVMMNDFYFLGSVATNSEVDTVREFFNDCPWTTTSGGQLTAFTWYEELFGHPHLLPWFIVIEIETFVLLGLHSDFAGA